MARPLRRIGTQTQCGVFWVTPNIHHPSTTMLTRKITVRRQARHVARLPDSTRPHGRRRGYAHTRQRQHAPRHRGGPRVLAGAMLAGVLGFLALVVSGALAPRPGPLIKHEPVSTARMR